MRVGAVILAAGAGERLGGRCKAALRLPDGQTFLEAIVASARAAGVAPVVVVAGPPHADETRRLAAGATVVDNPDPSRGMLSSLLVGLAAVGDGVDAALMWPVDHPFVSPATVAAVVAAATRDAAVVPTANGRGGHPTAFGRDLWPALAAAHTARDVLATVLVVRLPVDDPGATRDVDRAEDLA
jgi:CTP:molybdopterin cytidylyltransferase MocA